MSVRHGTANLCKENSGTQVAADLARLAPLVDVLGVQEVETSGHRAAVKARTKKGWTVHWPGGGTFLSRSENAVPILWRSDRFTLVASGKERTFAGKRGLSPARWIVWVVLRDLLDGSTVVRVNTHLIQQAFTSHPGNRPIWEHHAAMLDLRCRLLAHTYPDAQIVAGGDFNRSHWLGLVGTELWANHGTYGSAYYDYLVVQHGRGSGVTRVPINSDHDALVGTVTTAGKPAPAKPKPTPKPAPKPPEAPVSRPAAPSPPYVGPAAHTSSGANQPINRIVLHSTVSPCVPGGARATAAYFRSPRSGGSAHYIVDPREAVQVVWDDTIAWHSPPNAHSLGIEMCDMPSQDVRRWDDANHRAMYLRTVQLTAALCAAYGVPVVKLSAADLRAGHKGICGHVDVSQAWRQTDHWDPGAFPWDRFIADVRAVNGGTQRPAPAPPTPAAPVTPTQGDWFDMATKQDLEDVVAKYVGDHVKHPTKTNPKNTIFNSTALEFLLRLIPDVAGIKRDVAAIKKDVAALKTGAAK